MNQDSTGKRRHARLTFKEPIHELVTATHDVRILDLSLGGRGSSTPTSCARAVRVISASPSEIAA